MAHEPRSHDDSSNNDPPAVRHYGSFQPLALLRHAWKRIRRDAHPEVALIRDRLERDAARIQKELGRDLDGQRVLVVGPGQVMNEARFLSTHNDVTGLDIDVIPRGWNPFPYLRMLRTNGLGRLLKTLARKMLFLDRKWERAWCDELGVRELAMPDLVVGDICAGPPQEDAYDLVGSWAVFQHLPDPETALENMVKALKPGGVLYVGIHLYTSHSGHCDYRALTGGADELPEWGHLRPSTQDQIRSSAYLNRRRLIDWRELFSRIAPGYDEFLESYPDGPAPPAPEIREELSEYDDEELFTVDVFYRWKKPDTQSAPQREVDAEQQPAARLL